LVTAQLQLCANGHDGTQLPFKLQGQGLELISLSVDGNSLALGYYQLDAEELTIAAPGVCFEIKTTVRIKPQNNTSLIGLYKSNGNFFTQCEAEGFRKITYYIDRPDNLAIFTTTLIADKHHYPILLANGNKIALRSCAAAQLRSCAAR
jgi:aminopeptidase N